MEIKATLDVSGCNVVRAIIDTSLPCEVIALHNGHQEVTDTYEGGGSDHCECCGRGSEGGTAQVFTGYAPVSRRVGPGRLVISYPVACKDFELRIVYDDDAARVLSLHPAPTISLSGDRV